MRPTRLCLSLGLLAIGSSLMQPHSAAAAERIAGYAMIQWWGRWLADDSPAIGFPMSPSHGRIGCPSTRSLPGAARCGAAADRAPLSGIGSW